MSSSRRAGTARARSSKPKKVARRPPAPDTDQSRSPDAFVWPPTEQQLEGWLELEVPQEFVDDTVGGFRPDAPAPLSPAGALNVAVRRRLRLAGLLLAASAAALAGASVAWFTPPAAPPPSRFPQPMPASRPTSVAPDAGLPASTSSGNSGITTTRARPHTPSASLSTRAVAARPASHLSRSATDVGALSPLPDEVEPAVIAPAAAATTVSPLLPPAALAEDASAILTRDTFVSKTFAVSAAPTELRARQAIAQVLAQYRHAYDARDVAAAAAIWPSLDPVALERAFAGLREQQLQFDRCDVDVQNARATAVCPGSLTFVRRVGSDVPEIRRLAWTFALQRASDRWLIARVAAR